MSNILITGATGYIGRNLVQRLIAEEHYCRCLVRKNSRIDFLKDYSNVELFYGDITQKDSLTGICKGIDVVINSAGVLAKWDSSTDDLKSVNTDGITNLAGELVELPDLLKDRQLMKHMIVGQGQRMRRQNWKEKKRRLSYQDNTTYQ